ncbi:hypothetical protein CAEBREN_24228 [Caenorhabditis brenneri]|uniref:RING-type domain-containing protein n=1 Tax=Caenorhabditis brenneri TaxID=135651 RepID=G0P1B8_CAEBE|nr:hypothetical protein CAEBREN_24228 [Caenorhabditis brenneri]
MNDTPPFCQSALISSYKNMYILKHERLFRGLKIELKRKKIQNQNAHFECCYTTSMKLLFYVTQSLTHLSVAREEELKRHSIDLDMSCWASYTTKNFKARMETAESEARIAKEAIEADQARVRAEGKREDDLRCWREAQQAEEEAVMRMESVFEQHGALVDRVKKAKDRVREARIDSRRRGPVRSVFKCQICFKKYDFDKENMKPKCLTNCGHICCEKCVKKMTVVDVVECPYCREEIDCPVSYQLKRTGDEDSDTESEGEQEGEGFNSR